MENFRKENIDIINKQLVRFETKIWSDSAGVYWDLTEFGYLKKTVNYTIENC